MCIRQIKLYIDMWKEVWLETNIQSWCPISVQEILLTVENYFDLGKNIRRWGILQTQIIDKVERAVRFVEMSASIA